MSARPRKLPTVVVDPNQSLLKITEVATLLRVSVSCVRAWKSTKKIPVIQLGGKNLLFKRSDVEKFIEHHTTPAKGGVR